MTDTVALARCSADKACPARFRAGPDRACPLHAREAEADDWRAIGELGSLMRNDVPGRGHNVTAQRKERAT